MSPNRLRTDRLGCGDARWGRGRLLPAAGGPRRAFTLTELIVSAAILSILAAGMMSAVLVASHAMPCADNAAVVNAEAIEIVDQIAGDLMYATAVDEAQSAAITVTVADRGHGSAGPETIRYAWSGTPGDPLTREYNGGSPVAVCQHVENFSLTYSKTVGVLAHEPRVVMVVSNAADLESDDELRLTLLQSWGFEVDVQDDGADPGDFNAAVADADVVYISERAWSYKFKDKVSNMSLGLVLEEGFLLSSYEMAEGQKTTEELSIYILDNAHEITSGFSEGMLGICTSEQILSKTSGSLAADSRILAMLSDEVGLMAIEVGGTLLDGDRANGRRVKLPWGGDRFFEHFEFDSLTDDAKTILRRAIVWAAAPVVRKGVHVVVQTTSDSASRAEAEVQLLNQPEVSKP